jgi:hypothetical protein
MVARLGNVFYWLGCLVAGVFLLVTLANAAMSFFGSDHPVSIYQIAFSIGAASASWLIGRALRYIFAGT